MPASTFYKRIDRLIAQVGSGKIVTIVKVDQVYAKYQHERADLKHPAGGEAFYLRNGLMLGRNGYMSQIARQALNPGGIIAAMTRISEDIATESFRRAPFEFGDLKASPAPRVVDRGSRVYSRPAAMHRLSESEIKIKRRLRRLGLGN